MRAQVGQLVSDASPNAGSASCDQHHLALEERFFEHPAEPTQHQVRLATPFTDQKPGTSGLRKSSRQFEEAHYLERFIEASLRTLPGVQGGTLVVGATAVTATAVPST